jgi:hypothetical protein
MMVLILAKGGRDCEKEQHRGDEEHARFAEEAGD